MMANVIQKKTEYSAITKIIKAKAVLAPMAGITDIPFRIMARRNGCAFAFTEMIDSSGVIYKNRKTFKLLEKVPGDEPLGVQIAGEDKNALLDVAKVCENRGFDVLDVNAGCPVKKIVKQGKGSALLKEPLKLAGIVRSLVKELSIPVTVKIRSGWDDDSLNYIEVGKLLESEGVSAICIHPRTKDAMRKGEVNYDIIRQLKDSLNIPVFASGNIFTASGAIAVLEGTGCDAVFVARGALGQPWIFNQINSYRSGKSETEIPNFYDIKNMVLEHFKLSLQFYDEKMAIRKMYKHITWYLKKRKNLDSIMKEYRRVEDFKGFQDFFKRLHMNEKNHLELL